MFALVFGSKIQSPFVVFKAGMLDTAGLLSINRRVLAHQPLLPGRSWRSFWALSFVYSRNCLNIPALHASAASRAFAVPSAACFASTKSSTSSVSHGCVDFFSWIIFCGMQSCATSLMPSNRYCDAASGSIVSMQSQSVSSSMLRILSQSAFAYTHTVRGITIRSGTLNGISATTSL